MHEVQVRYFAALKEQRGCSEEMVAIRPGETAQQLYERLFPAINGQRLTVMFAINQHYAQPETQVCTGDEVAFIPPLGGG